MTQQTMFTEDGRRCPKDVLVQRLISAVHQKRKCFASDTSPPDNNRFVGAATRPCASWKRKLTPIEGAVPSLQVKSELLDDNMHTYLSSLVARLRHKFQFWRRHSSGEGCPEQPDGMWAFLPLFIPENLVKLFVNSTNANLDSLYGEDAQRFSSKEFWMFVRVWMASCVCGPAVHWLQDTGMLPMPPTRFRQLLKAFSSFAFPRRIDGDSSWLEERDRTPLLTEVEECISCVNADLVIGNSREVFMTIDDDLVRCVVMWCLSPVWLCRCSCAWL